jgi:hypothetical protein
MVHPWTEMSPASLSTHTHTFRLSMHVLRFKAAEWAVDLLFQELERRNCSVARLPRSNPSIQPICPCPCPNNIFWKPDQRCTNDGKMVLTGL